MYWLTEFDCLGRMATPRSRLARCRPSSWDWLNERSLNLPMSLISAILTLPAAGAVVVLPLVVVGAASSLLPPQPASANASARTTSPRMRSPVLTRREYLTVSLRGPHVGTAGPKNGWLPPMTPARHRRSVVRVASTRPEGEGHEQGTRAHDGHREAAETDSP